VLLLGSASPRRRELIAALGIPFRVAPPDVDETLLAGETPWAYLERIGLLKAAALQAQNGDRALLVADTTVVVDDHILAKPEDAAEAQRMLEELSGRTHVVATRFVVRRLADGETHAETVRTDVVFRALSRSELVAYAQSGEGTDKAGGYAIQGGAAAFVREIRGSYTNVVGLPLAHVAVALERLGLR
jgi:septum formation protein